MILDFLSIMDKWIVWLALLCISLNKAMLSKAVIWYIIMFALVAYGNVIIPERKIEDNIAIFNSLMKSSWNIQSISADNIYYSFWSKLYLMLGGLAIMVFVSLQANYLDPGKAFNPLLVWALIYMSTLLVFLLIIGVKYIYGLYWNIKQGFYLPQELRSNNLSIATVFIVILGKCLLFALIITTIIRVPTLDYYYGIYLGIAIIVLCLIEICYKWKVMNPFIKNSLTKDSHVRSLKMLIGILVISVTIGAMCDIAVTLYCDYLIYMKRIS